MDSWPWHVLVRVPTVSGTNCSVWVSTNVNNSPKIDLRVEKWLTSLCPLSESVWDPTGLSRNVEYSERLMKKVTLCICDLIVSQPESLLVPAGVWHKLGDKKIESQISDFTWVRGLMTFSRSWRYGNQMENQVIYPWLHSESIRVAVGLGRIVCHLISLRANLKCCWSYGLITLYFKWLIRTKMKCIHCNHLPMPSSFYYFLVCTFLKNTIFD